MHEISAPLAVPGKARPRVTRHGTYVPREYVRARDSIRAATIAEMGEEPPAEGPVSVTVAIRRAAPKSLKRPEPDTHRPDIDNCAGTVLDALNGVAWADDAQVVALAVRKLPREPGAGPLLVVTWDGA